MMEAHGNCDVRGDENCKCWSVGGEGVVRAAVRLTSAQMKQEMRRDEVDETKPSSFFQRNVDQFSRR